jgi:predicted nucleotidyltransferase
MRDFSSMIRVMNSLVTARLDDVLALCERHGVARLWVFGSAAAPSTDERPFEAGRSDLDFLVEFRPLPVGALADAYFGLREGLFDLFKRRVDLVTVDSLANPYFRDSVERTRVPVYAAA